MTTRTVLVGGAGFIGTALAAGLRASGRRVSVLDTSRRLDRVQAALPGCALHKFDFPRLDGLGALLDGAAEVIHLACTTTPASSMLSLARDAETNIAPSVALFEAAGRAGVRRILFASSGGTVYGNPGQIPVTEDRAGNPLSGYGASKLCIEHYLALAAGQHGLDGLSLRIGNPYGPYQLAGTRIGVIARYLSETHAGRPLEVWGDGQTVRDYLYIDDLVSAVLSLLDAGTVASGPYNIGSGIGTSLNEIIEVIRQVTGRRIEVRHEKQRRFDVDSIILDTGRIRSATGWQPRISLLDGIGRLWRDLQGA